MRESILMAINKIMDTSNKRRGGNLKYGLLVVAFSIGVSWVILKVLDFISKVEVSITDVLLLALLLLIPVIVSSNTEILKLILRTQQKQSEKYWDYRVYKVDENPSNVSPTILISNVIDVTELSKLGYKTLNSEGGGIQTLSLEKGMSMLNRIGWELVQVQRIGEFRYYYIFRRASVESIVI